MWNERGNECFFFWLTMICIELLNRCFAIIPQPTIESNFFLNEKLIISTKITITNFLIEFWF